MDQSARTWDGSLVAPEALGTVPLPVVGAHAGGPEYDPDGSGAGGAFVPLRVQPALRGDLQDEVAGVERVAQAGFVLLLPAGLRHRNDVIVHGLPRLGLQGAHQGRALLRAPLPLQRTREQLLVVHSYATGR